MPPFPRDKLFRLATSRIKAYAAINPLERIPVNLHEITHEDQTYRYRYVMRVTTFNNESEEEVTRYVSLTDDKRFTKQDLQGAARDLIMESKVSSNEDFVSADVIYALRKG